MLTVRLLNAVKKPPSGTLGSSAAERGFDVRIETKPSLRAYRVAVVWTQNGWQAVDYTECKLVEVRNDTDICAIWTVKGQGRPGSNAGGCHGLLLLKRTATGRYNPSPLGEQPFGLFDNRIVRPQRL